MSFNERFEFELRRDVLSHSITSENPSEEAKQKARQLSPSYFADLKKDLMIKYDGKKLSDISGSKVFKTEHGETLQIVNSQKVDFEIKDNNFRSQINHNLKLLPKIGVKTEKNLKQKGFLTIELLLNHDSYSDAANKFLSRIDEMSFLEIMNLLNDNKYGAECRDNLIKCISLCDEKDFKFMDIETVGLSNVPIILIGVAEIKKNKIITTQYFLRDYLEEIAVIEGYLSHLNETSVHVTFNGKRFDVPFIQNRMDYYGFDENINLAHIDLMFLAKYLWSEDLPDCKLQTIEKEKFSIEREGDVPGQYIPEYYRTYLKEDNIGPIVPIIEHNRQDIVSLASFLDKMYEEVN